MGNRCKEPLKGDDELSVQGCHEKREAHSPFHSFKDGAGAMVDVDDAHGDVRCTDDSITER